MERVLAAHAAQLLVILVPLLLFTAHTVTAGTDQLFKPMFVLAGDSITEFGFVDGGWGIMLAETYRRKADVINRGFGGYTSRMGVYILDEFLNSFGSGRIKLVTLCFGANDASHPTGIGGYLHVPLDEFKANLVAMVKKLKSKGISNIVILTPPPVVDKIFRRQDGSYATGPTSADVKKYAAAAINVARTEGVPYVDLFNGIPKAISSWQTTALEEDGRHLTPVAQKVVYDSLMYVIRNSLQPISPESLPYHMPTYREINARYPAATFNSLYGYKVNTGVELPPPTPPPTPAAASKLAPAPAAVPATAAATTTTTTTTATAGTKQAIQLGKQAGAAAAATATAATKQATQNGRQAGATAAAPAAAASKIAALAPLHKVVPAQAAKPATAARAIPAAAPKPTPLPAKPAASPARAQTAAVSAKPAAQRRPMKSQGARR